MKVVLDTNVVLSSLGSRSPLRWLFEAFLHQRFIMLVSTEILLEHEEILAELWIDCKSEFVTLKLLSAQKNLNCCLQANSLYFPLLQYCFSFVRRWI